MKLFKSKAGFTLIELLVVIGILAVLAAIAIPSVAGLIDRANVSADKTNSNEMTNAIERFTSEYELYCQDIASGVIKSGQTSDFDSAQGRVYNVTKVTDRNGISTLEKDASAGPSTTGPAIYRDTKYPVNAETVKAIVENYTKTSSSTFEPKQSDMHFWYSPACGVVVVATPESSIAEKNDLIISGMDAKGRELDDSAEIWIDLTSSINNGEQSGGSNDDPSAISAQPGLYETGSNYTVLIKTWDELIADGIIQETDGVIKGVSAKKADLNGDLYLSTTATTIGSCAFQNWQGITGVYVPDNITTAESMAFQMCYSLTSVRLPKTQITNGRYMFLECKGLIEITIPDGWTSIPYGFCQYANKLTTANLPSTLKTIEQNAFNSCSKLTNFTLPEGLEKVGRAAFHYCYGIKNLVLPSTLKVVEPYAFQSLTGLESMTMKSAIGDISSWTNCSYYDQPFMNPCNMVTLTIDESVTTIPTNTFVYARKIKTIYIPSTMTHIADGAFHLDEFNPYNYEITIHYDGTIEQWNSIATNKMFSTRNGADTLTCTVICTDGETIMTK